MQPQSGALTLSISNVIYYANIQLNICQLLHTGVHQNCIMWSNFWSCIAKKMRNAANVPQDCRPHEVSNCAVKVSSCYRYCSYLCNRHGALVDEEAAVLDIPTRLVVRDRLGEELGCVAVKEHAGRMSSIVCILLHDSDTLLVTCNCTK